MKFSRGFVVSSLAAVCLELISAVTRRFLHRASTIPVEQYASVRSFFERIRAAEQSPVVLAKK